MRPHDVMPGLVPGIHDFLLGDESKTQMVVTRTATTMEVMSCLKTYPPLANRPYNPRTSSVRGAFLGVP